MSYTKVLISMAAALGFRDQYTHDHVQRVAAYAGRLAEHIGLTDREIVQITFGGMLHDIGKIALSDRIFSSDSISLSKGLLLEVRSHPTIGAAMLNQINCKSTIRDVVLYHHERMDGSGYPFGLKSESIPLAARIVSIADIFDAVTSNRSYQKSKSCEEAFEVLENAAGAYLDTDLVSSFITDIRCNGIVRLQQKQGAWGCGFFYGFI